MVKSPHVTSPPSSQLAEEEENSTWSLALLGLPLGHQLPLMAHEVVPPSQTLAVLKVQLVLPLSVL